MYVVCILFVLNSASLDGRCDENSEQEKVAMVGVISELSSLRRIQFQ